MSPDYFLGEIIVESLISPACLDPIKDCLIKTRTADMPMEPIPFWHVHRYRLPRAQVLTIAPLIEQALASGEWYVHFFSELNDELIVIMKGRIFRLPKVRDNSWEEMMRYGESVGVSRRWTQSIPLSLPA